MDRFTLSDQIKVHKVTDLLCKTMRGNAAMKITSPSKTTTSVQFRLRARHYRLAAAISDAPREVAMFRDLAWTFDRLSEDFARAEARRHSL
jgi:hypothetical protein